MKSQSCINLHFPSSLLFFKWVTFVCFVLVLYKLWVLILLDIYLAKSLSHPGGFLFTRLTVSLALQSIL